MVKVYAAYHKKTSEIEKSSSGGMFAALSDCILSNGGRIIAGKYNYANQKLEHVVCSTSKERDLCRGSKYFQSAINGNIYNSLAEILASSTPVLFMGMPCQVAAVNQFVKIKELQSDQLYTCDILCHGVGSPGIWSSFINWKNDKTDYITFKDKRRGWNKPLCVARRGKKEFSIRGYSWLYFSNLILRPSCYECPYTRTVREGDITIGDFWKVKTKAPDMYNPYGTSFIMVNSEKGRSLFEKMKNDIVYKEVELDDISQNSMQHPVDRPSKRKRVMEDFSRISSCVFFRKWEIKLFFYKMIKDYVKF